MEPIHKSWIKNGLDTLSLNRYDEPLKHGSSKLSYQLATNFN